jgi:thiamine biosynthesis lipoprotein
MMQSDAKTLTAVRGCLWGVCFLGACWLSGPGCDVFQKENKQSPKGKGGALELMRSDERPADPRILVQTRTYMGTVFRIMVVVPGTKRPKGWENGAGELDTPTREARKRARRVCELAFREIGRVEALMSVHRSDSQVVRLNEASQKAAQKGASKMNPLKVDREVILVLEEALQVSRLSGAAFDVTYAVLSGVWKQQRKHGKLPAKKTIKQVLKLVDYHGIKISKDDSTVQLRPGQQIDLGGIAKGYGLDRAAVTLKEHGFKHFIVYGGGDLLVSGRHPDRPWRVGVQDPDQRGYFAYLDVTNVAVVTSGDYQRYFMHKGKRYHHILNPRTGFPARGVRSVTVLADRAVYADGMATALFVMGLEKGKALVDRLADTHAVFVTADGKVVVTSGLGSRLKLLHRPGQGKTGKRKKRKAGARKTSGQKSGTRDTGPLTAKPADKRAVHAARDR